MDAIENTVRLARLDAAFDRAYQGGSILGVDKLVGKGTGLGLATVHGIVKQAGGSVAVYSEVAMGTSFKVYFPRASAAEMVVEALPASRPHARAETVLVVEDAEGLRQLTGRLLERLGYTVLLAANADEGFSCSSGMPPSTCS